MIDILRGLLGMGFFLGVAYLLSPNKKAINWRVVIVGISLQIVFGLLISKVPAVARGFASVADGFVLLLEYGLKGAIFVFSDLAKNSSESPSALHKMGFIFAFQVLPILIFFSSLTAALYYLGILQKAVFLIAWVMERSMKLTGAESLSAAGNIFLGQTEAPLLVKPYIPIMTKSELMALMTGGMATLAGSVFAAYISFLGGGDPVLKAKFAGYLLSASVMNAPAGLVMAKMLVPESNPDPPSQKLTLKPEALGNNFIDAIAKGAIDGLQLALNVGAMLIAFVSLVALTNGILSWIGEIPFLSINEAIRTATDGTFDGLSLQFLFGQLFRVIAWFMGVAWSETALIGSLLGIKTAINEFLAYLQLQDFIERGVLSQKSIVIATFALAGFANFSSIAIQVGGIGALAPSRQGDISRLGITALIGGTLACLMTGTLAGVLID